MNLFGDGMIDLLYMSIGIAIFVLSGRIEPIGFLAITVMILEYVFSPFLIHNSAPYSVVAMVSGDVGNYGIFIFCIASLSIIINRFDSFILYAGSKYTIRGLKLMLGVYAYYSVHSYYENYGFLFSTSAVNGHCYYLSGLSLLAFVFEQIRKKSISTELRVALGINLFLTIFIFKTRAVILIDVLLFLFSFNSLRKILLNEILKLKIARLFLLSMIAAPYIAIFLLPSILVLVSSFDSVPLFAKEASGLRDVAILQWSLYINEVYGGGSVIVPDFTPHSTLIGLPAYIGIFFSIIFTMVLISTLFLKIKNSYHVQNLLIIGAIAFTMAVVFVSPVSHFYFLIIFVILIRLIKQQWSRDKLHIDAP
jgi:hypothetical protein